MIKKKIEKKIITKKIKRTNQRLFKLSNNSTFKKKNKKNSNKIFLVKSGNLQISQPWT